MFKNILIGIFLVAAAAFAYLYETEKSLNEDLNMEQVRYQRDLAFSDSINTVVINANTELTNANRVYQEENANVKWELERLEEKLSEAKVDLQNKTLEEVAQYIIDNFLGDSYKIMKYNGVTFIEFKELTVRDIAERDIEFKALFKRSELLSRDLANKDTLIKKQAKTINIMSNANGTLLVKHMELAESNNTCQNKVIDLTTEVDKQKGLKRIGFYTAGGLALLLIIL